MTLAQIAREMLDETDTLAARIVSHVWGVVPGYELPRMRRADLEDAVAPNVRSVLGNLLAPTSVGDHEDRARARRLGATRALQGVPLDVVVQSFRTGERVVVDEFVAHARDTEVGELREGLERIAQGFDRLSSVAIDAYRDTQQELTAHYDRVAGDLVAGLLSGELTPQQAEERALLLDCDPTSPYQAVALRTGRGGELSSLVQFQRQILAALAVGRPGRILLGKARGADLFLVPGGLEHGDRTRLREVLATWEALDPRIAHGTVSPHLGAAGRSCRQALAAMAVADSVRSSNEVAYDDVLVPVILLRGEDATERLVERLYRPLAGHPHLLDTAREFLAADGSIRETARRLFVHPNTVVYRLGRIRTLTGVDPRRLQDFLPLTLAIEAALLHPEER